MSDLLLGFLKEISFATLPSLCNEARGIYQNVSLSRKSIDSQL